MNKSCLAKALRTLTRRDHSCRELGAKLKSAGFDEPDIVDTINTCLKLGYLNDKRYADAQLIRLQRKGNGVNLIRKKLLARGIPEYIVSEFIASRCTDPIELDVCRQVLAKKTRHMDGSVQKSEIRAKLQRFLISRGFTYQIIQKTLAQEDE